MTEQVEDKCYYNIYKLFVTPIIFPHTEKHKQRDTVDDRSARYYMYSHSPSRLILSMTR